MENHSQTMIVLPMTSNQWNTSFIYLDRCLLCNLQAPWKPWNVFVRLSNNCWNLSTHNLELERQRVRDKNFICWGCVTKNPKIFRSKWEQNNRGIVNAKKNNWELLPSFQVMSFVKKAPVLQNFSVWNCEFSESYAKNWQPTFSVHQNQTNFASFFGVLQFSKKSSN